jgi:DNA-binding NarL/FixJ family response regulator
MRMIAGLDRPTTGTVRVNGKHYPGAAAPMSELGILLDARSVHSGLSARNNLLALARTAGIGRRRVDEVIELAGLAEVAGTRGPEAPSSHPAAQLRQTLTSREHDVFSRIAAGMSNSEIAASLFLSEGTVKIHVGRILAKLGLRDRVQAVVLAYESGVITPGTPPPDAPGAGIPRTV